MLKRYNRKFIHNMPRIAFPTKPPSVRVENRKRDENRNRTETPKQESVETRRVKPAINEIKPDYNDIARTEE